MKSLQRQYLCKEGPSRSEKRQPCECHRHIPPGLNIGWNSWKTTFTLEIATVGPVNARIIRTEAQKQRPVRHRCVPVNCQGTAQAWRRLVPQAKQTRPDATMATATSDDHRTPRAGQPLCVPTLTRSPTAKPALRRGHPTFSHLWLRFRSEP